MKSCVTHCVCDHLPSRRALALSAHCVYLLVRACVCVCFIHMSHMQASLVAPKVEQKEPQDKVVVKNAGTSMLVQAIANLVEGRGKSRAKRRTGGGRGPVCPKKSQGRWQSRPASVEEAIASSPEDDAASEATACSQAVKAWPHAIALHSSCAGAGASAV